MIPSLLTSFAIHIYGATPPGQPVSGPGGNGYLYASVTQYEFGQGATKYWVYEPADPVPESAPLVIFLHGWSSMNPKFYGAWIKHIVLRGNIVVFPVYQDSLHTQPSDFFPNTISSLREALLVLNQAGHVHPMLDKVAVVGHSMGGLMSSDLAAAAQAQGLPQPKAVMCVEPGGERFHYQMQDLSLIPAETLLLAVVGDADHLAKDTGAKKIFKGSTSVPLSNKNYIIVQSDNHGTPQLMANHFAPVAPDEEFDSKENPGENNRPFMRFIKWRMNQRLHLDEKPDALNYYGYWKLFDALCDAAFYGKNRDYALGNTPNQRYMGQWSDGVPVKELIVSTPKS